jgi:hypothetical protein
MKSSEKFSDNQEITLESVTKDFDLWRQTKTTHRIPDHLWDKVFLLLKVHGIGLVSNTLKISYSQIEVKRQARRSAQNQSKEPDFVTVNVDAKLGIQSVSANITPVEVTLKNGCIIQCEMTITDLIHVIHGPFDVTN